MSCVDSPDKKQKHLHYEHRTTKLDLKDNEFTSQKFQQIRKVSTHKKLIESLKKIGMCVNDKSSSSIPTANLDQVCFLLINDYDKADKKLGVGPLNDGYLVGLKYHRLGFKVFYLYNSRREEFTTILGFFIRSTSITLTVFYSGRDVNSEGIEFNDGPLSKSVIGEVISHNANGQTRVLFIADSLGSGSVFDINGCSNMISFSVQKVGSTESKEVMRSHGIFTYYFCKIISECPNITPKRLVERMNPSLSRFNESFTYEATNTELNESPIFN